MNILVDDLPDEVDGIPVYTDYRNMIMFEELMCDDGMSSYEKLCAAVDLFYKEPVRSVDEAWNGLLWFYSCGNNTSENGKKHNAARSRSVYDFEQDAQQIYASFMQVYGIDLQEKELHWWSFRAMLSCLPETCSMGEIMRIRATDTSKLKGAEKKRIERLQKFYAIKRPAAKAAVSAVESERQLREYVLRRHREAEEWLKKNK